MEILDKITRTVKQASDSAKVLADKNHVRKDIAAIENELRRLYHDIGEQYYKENQNAPAPEYASLFASVSDLQNELNNLQRELELLTGAMTCRYCGRTFPTDARFCPYCGEQVPAELLQPAPAEAPAESLCSACGAQLAPDAVFCAVCGNPVAPKNENQPEQPKDIVCTGCGKILPPDAMFCDVCGTKAPDVN